MNEFEKEFMLSNSFPRFKLDEMKKEKILTEILKSSKVLSRKNTIIIKSKVFIAFATTILLTFGILFSFVSYQTAALYEDKKILNDISIGMEKARTLLIKYTFDKSGIPSIDKAYELLEKYYTSDALIEIFATVESTYNKDIRTKEEYDQYIANTPAHFAMGNLHEAKDIEIIKTEKGKVKVSWFDNNINEKVSINCVLKEKKWIIENIEI